MAAPFVNFLQAPLQESAFKELGNVVDRYQDSQLRGQEMQLNQARLENMPFEGLNGQAMNELRVNLLEKKFGPDDPRVMAARKGLELQNKETESQIRARNTNEQLMRTRTLSPEARQQEEIADVRAGYKPATNRSEEIPPEEKERYWRNLQLAMVRKTTDPDMRKRLSNAINIDKTLSTFTPEDITRYVGPAGKFEKLIQQGKALTGKQSEEYRKYKKAQDSLHFLVDQAIGYFGSSVSPEVRHSWEKLLDKEEWLSNPELAADIFDNMKGILLRETDTLYDAMTNPAFYERPGEQDEIAESLMSDDKISPKKAQSSNKKSQSEYADPLGIR